MSPLDVGYVGTLNQHSIHSYSCRSSCKPNQSVIEDQVDAQIRIARLWVLRSEADEAETSAKAALQAAKGNDLAEAQASLGMARVLMAKKDLPGAKAQAANAEKLFKTCGHRSGELTALSLTWSAMLEEGGAAQMVQAAKKAAEAFKAAGDQQCAAEAYLEASAASKKHGQPESADTATAALQLFRQLQTQLRADKCHRLPFLVCSCLLLSSPLVAHSGPKQQAALCNRVLRFSEAWPHKRRGQGTVMVCFGCIRLLLLLSPFLPRLSILIDSTGGRGPARFVRSREGQAHGVLRVSCREVSSSSSLYERKGTEFW